MSRSSRAKLSWTCSIRAVARHLTVLVPIRDSDRGSGPVAAPHLHSTQLDGAVGAESGLELCERLDRRIRPIGFVLVERRRALLARHLDGDDLRREMTCGLRGGEKLL